MNLFYIFCFDENLNFMDITSESTITQEIIISRRFMLYVTIVNF